MARVRFRTLQLLCLTSAGDALGAATVPEIIELILHAVQRQSQVIDQRSVGFDGEEEQELFLMPHLDS